MRDPRRLRELKVATVATATGGFFGQLNEQPEKRTRTSIRVAEAPDLHKVRRSQVFEKTFQSIAFGPL